MTLDGIAGMLPGYTSGPHEDTSTVAAARILAHATRHGAGGVTEPATACAVAGELTALAHALPQVCGQLASWIEAGHAAGRRASALGTVLAAAQAAAGHLQRPGTGERP